MGYGTMRDEKRAPFTHADVFRHEIEAIEARRRAVGRSELHVDQPKPNDVSSPTDVLRYGLVGLALSGGGIRSAAFNLGVLQALSRGRVLQECDYLSTVSGGGYIGACLTSMLSGDITAPAADPTRFPLARVNPTKIGSESEALRHIRKRSSYLIAHPGILRIDTWRAISAYARGLLLTISAIASTCGLVASAALGLSGGAAKGVMSKASLLAAKMIERLDWLPWWKHSHCCVSQVELVAIALTTHLFASLAILQMSAWLLVGLMLLWHAELVHIKKIAGPSICEREERERRLAHWLRRAALCLIIGLLPTTLPALTFVAKTNPVVLVGVCAAIVIAIGIATVSVSVLRRQRHFIGIWLMNVGIGATALMAVWLAREHVIVILIASSCAVVLITFVNLSISTARLSTTSIATS